MEQQGLHTLPESSGYASGLAEAARKLCTEQQFPVFPSPHAVPWVSVLLYSLMCKGLKLLLQP